MDIIYMYHPDHGSMSLRSGLNVIHSSDPKATAFWSHFPTQILYQTAPDAASYMQVTCGGATHALHVGDDFSQYLSLPESLPIYSYYNVIGPDYSDAPPSVPPFSNGAMQAKFIASQEVLRQSKPKLTALRAQQAQWAQIDRQNALRDFQTAQRVAQETAHRSQSLTAMASDLPSESELQQMEDHAAILSAAAPKIGKMRIAASHEAAAAAKLQEEVGEHVTSDPSVAAAISWITAFLAACLAALCFFFVPDDLPKLLCGSIAGVAALAGIVLSLTHHAKVKRIKQDYENTCTDVEKQLLHARQSQKSAQDAADAYQEGILSLAKQVNRYISVSVSLESVRQALTSLRHQLSAVQLAQNDASDALQQLKIAKDQLPSGPLPGSGRALTPPELDRETLVSQMSRIAAAMQAARLTQFELFFPAESGVPLILDDAFFNLEGKWLYAAMDYLQKMSQTRQILFFTSQSPDKFFPIKDENVNFVSIDWTE